MTITVIKTPFDISYRADTLEHSYDYEVLFTDRNGKLLTYKGGLCGLWHLLRFAVVNVHFYGKIYDNVQKT